MANYSQSVVVMQNCWRPVCSCGWRGILYRRDASIEYRRLAERDAADHGWCHDNGKGWFDYFLGWVEGPEAYNR